MTNKRFFQNGIKIGRSLTPSIEIESVTGSTGSINFDDNTTTANITYNHTTDNMNIGLTSGDEVIISPGLVTIMGDFHVAGTTTTVGSADLQITDNIILLNKDEVGAGVTIGQAGIEIDRGSLDNAGWYYNEATDWWGPTGPSGTFGIGIGATQTIGNISVIDATDSTDGILTISGEAIVVPSGPTAGQPASIVNGGLRYNDDTNALELYTVGTWKKITASSSGDDVVVEGDLDLSGNTILNPLDPTLGNHVGDRDYNDARYLQQTNLLSEISLAGAPAQLTARTNLGLPSLDSYLAVSGDTMEGVLTMSDNILPDVDNIHNIGSAVLKFNTMHAITFDGEATSSLYADIAERYASDMELEPGTVVVFGGKNEITISTNMGDTSVAGIISTKPGVMLNKEYGPDITHPYVALKGKVPCKVVGNVKKGDLLITSDIPGHAMSSSNRAEPYTAFARANEDFNGEKGIIQASPI